MKNICIFDTSQGTLNMGDYIIKDSCMRELKDIIGSAKVNATKQAEAIAKKSAKKQNADTGSQMDSKATYTADDKTVADGDIKPVDGTVK